MKYRIIFKAIVGSRSYGTNIETSDTDYKGIYIQDPDEILSNRYKEQIQVGKDECYYELSRFIQLSQSGNPTVLELLFSPKDCIIITSPEYELLRANADMFLTKKCQMAFAGYAFDQIKKAKGLNKKMNWEADKITRKDVLDFCFISDKGKTFPVKDWLIENNMKQEYIGLTGLDHFADCYAVYYSETSGYKGIIGDKSNEVRLSSIPKGELPVATMYYNWREYSKHCREYNEYQDWLKHRNTQRYVDVQNHNQKIDGKNLMHCRRLIDVAKEIATDHTINVRRPNAQYLLSIRRGEVSLQDLIDSAQNDIDSLKSLYEQSGLPDKVDIEAANELILKIRKINSMRTDC